MQTEVKYSWRFVTYSIKAKTKCSICGKPITKTFSFELREDGKPSRQDWDNLERAKQHWLEESHVCSKCMANQVVGVKEDITSKFIKQLNRINKLYEELEDFKLKTREKQDKLTDEINPQLIGKVLLAKNRQWVIRYVRANRDNELEIYCDGIDCRYPWKTCNKELYVKSNTKYHWDTDKTFYATIDECTITDEIFDKRGELRCTEANI